MSQAEAKPNRLELALDRVSKLEKAIVDLLGASDPWRGKRGTEHELTSRKNAVALVKHHLETET